MKLKIAVSLVLSILVCSHLASAQPGKTTNEKLSVISSLHVNDNPVGLPEDSILRKHLKIELITENVYLAKQKTRVNWLVPDTSKIRKKNGLLRLPISGGSKTFTDKLVDDDGRQEYEYLGQFIFLNTYLVFCMYWEDLQYQLISKKNGATVGTFSALPYISPDKKRIISVYDDPYESESGIDLSSIVNNSIKSTVRVRFKNWMTAPAGGMFWAVDGKFYIRAQFSDKYWSENGNYNTDYLYIRISLL